MAVTFGLLGEVEARLHDQIVDLGPAPKGCLLAALLVDVNRPVSVEMLLDRVWAARPRSGPGTCSTATCRGYGTPWQVPVQTSAVSPPGTNSPSTP